MSNLNDNRIAWVIALATLALAGASAIGFQSPGPRLTKVETELQDHETRIQKLEDTGKMIEAIAKAVGAEIPVKGK